MFLDCNNQRRHCKVRGNGRNRGFGAGSEIETYRHATSQQSPCYNRIPRTKVNDTQKQKCFLVVNLNSTKKSLVLCILQKTSEIKTKPKK